MSVGTETEIIAATMKSRKAFDVAIDLIDPDTLTPMGKRIYEGIEHYYKLDDTADKVNPGTLFSQLEQSFSNKQHREQLKEAIQDASALEISASNVMQLALDQKRQAVGYKLAESLLNDEPDTELLEQYTKVIGVQSFEDLQGDELVGVGFDYLLPSMANENKIPVYPNSLNDRIDGGLIRGDAVIAGGRPEAGKTAWVVTNLAGQAYHGHKVLYLGNEDALARIIPRVQLD